MEKEIIQWIYEAASKIKTGLGDALKVDQKRSHRFSNERR